MFLFIKLGAKNLFRNKRRSFIASLAIGVGLAALILTDGFWQGMLVNMVENVTDSFLGHGQIHQRDFQKTLAVEKIISNHKEIKNKLERNPDIQNYTFRTFSVAMLSSAEDAVNISLVGINPDTETNVSQIEKRLVEGQYLEQDQDILIGTKIQQKLGVSIGDRVVVTASQAHSGELAQALYRVKGVFTFGSREMDDTMAFVKISNSQKLLAIGDNVHEIAFRFNSLDQVDLQKSFFKDLSSNDNIAESWKDLAPGIVSVIDMSGVSITIVSTILLALVSLGILNTLFMSLYERLFEFGVLRALGTRSSEVLLMILSEAAALSVISIFVGIVISLLIGTYWAYYGLDYSGIEFAEITFKDRIYFIFSLKQYLLYPFIIMAFTVFVGLYPGIHATRITLAKALKKSL